MEKPKEFTSSVDANAWVCLRCQTAVQPVDAPHLQKRSVSFSRRRSVSVGASSYYTPGKHVCGLCGGGSLVPAGTPRGQKILSASGIAVTGKLRSQNGVGCGTILLIIAGAILFFGAIIWQSLK